jgi:hypothetical protein
VAAAQLLEDAGREGDRASVVDALERLEREMTRLEPALIALREEITRSS